MLSLFSDKSSSTRVEDLKNEILDTLKDKNNWINLKGILTIVTFDFEDNTLDDNIGYVLRLLTHNQKHDTMFVLHTVRETDHHWREKTYKTILLEKMLEYVKNKPEDILSYTVIWYKNTRPTDIIKSYFYGYNLLDVCAKFYHDKYELDYMITSISLHSESQEEPKKTPRPHNTPKHIKNVIKF
jgi:hypothetical protein